MIDLKELRKIASQGLPDDAGIRSLVWKVYQKNEYLLKE